MIATKVTPGVPGVKPVEIELTDFKTKKVVDTLEVDACMVATGRAPYTSGAVTPHQSLFSSVAVTMPPITP